MRFNLFNGEMAIMLRLQTNKYGSQGETVNSNKQINSRKKKSQAGDWLTWPPQWELARFKTRPARGHWCTHSRADKRKRDKLTNKKANKGMLWTTTTTTTTTTEVKQNENLAKNGCKARNKTRTLRGSRIWLKRELLFPKTRDFSEVHHCDSVYSQGKDTSGQVKRHSQQRRMRRRQIMRRGFSILIIIFSSGSPTECPLRLDSLRHICTLLILHLQFTM